MLDKNINYIVSGLERSGTSMMMQILEANRLPIAYDEERKPDEHNPKGYYELDNGKIITGLRDGVFPIENYKGKIIKITAYGLQYLPEGRYKIIFMTRNLNEIVESMHRMYRDGDKFRREDTKHILEKLLKFTKSNIKDRKDIRILYINYNRLLNSPDVQLKYLYNFIGNINIEKSKYAINHDLYRNRYV